MVSEIIPSTAGDIGGQLCQGAKHRCAVLHCGVNFAAAIQKAVAILLPQLQFNYPALNPLISILLSGFAYMLILGTTYGKGIVIAILKIILTVLLLFIVGLLGLSVGTFV